MNSLSLINFPDTLFTSPHLSSSDKPKSTEKANPCLIKVEKPLNELNEVKGTEIKTKGSSATKADYSFQNTFNTKDFQGATHSEIPNKDLEKVKTFTPFCHGLIRLYHSVFVADFRKEHGKELSVPSEEEMIRLLTPLWEMKILASDDSRVGLTPEIIKDLHERWSLHFLSANIIKSSAPTLSEKEFNTQSLGIGICGGVTSEHIIKRLANPCGPLKSNAAFPLKPHDEYFPGKAYPFERSAHMTSTMRFLQAAGSLQVTFFDPDNSHLYLPPQIEERYKIRNLGHLSTANSKVEFPITGLMETLNHNFKRVADSKNQLMLFIGNGKEWESHILSIQCSSPIHLMDPNYGVIEYASTEEAIIGIALYLSAFYPEHKRMQVLEYAKTT